jgi:hypothetical protein
MNLCHWIFRADLLQAIHNDENQGTRFAKPTVGVAAAGGVKRMALGDIQNTMRAAASFTAAPLKSDPMVISSTAAPAAAAIAVQAPRITAPSMPPPAAKRPLYDIDANDARDIRFVSEYIGDIMQYLFEKEVRDAIPSNYMASQSEINERLRTKLVDWMTSVHLAWKLQPETLHLSFRLLDMYLSAKPCARSRLQLVGTVALMLACKVEEIHSFDIREWAALCDGLYEEADVRAFERHFLCALKWNVVQPTAFQFLQRFLKASSGDRVVQLLAHYLCELSVGDYRMLKYAPSQIAAGSLYTAHKMCNINVWVRFVFSLVALVRLRVYFLHRARSWSTTPGTARPRPAPARWTC